MQCIHRTFYALRTVFLYIFMIFCAAVPQALANPLYTVADVKVDVTAQSAVAAREQAFEQAQVDAFNTLAGRILPAERLAGFTPPDVNTVSAMIQDYEIGSEQLSTVRYVASYTFRFKESAARQYFGSMGADIYGAQAAFTAIGEDQNALATTAEDSENLATSAGTPSGTLLILPFYEKSGNTMLWSPYNVWRNAWNKTGGAGSASAVQVPLGDLADVSDIKDDEAMNYDPAKLARMLERNAAVEAVIAIARPDEALSRVSAEGDAAVGVLNVALYRTDMGTPQFVHDINVGASNSDTLGTLMDKAVREVKLALASGWKDKATVQEEIASGTPIQVRIPYNSLREWAEAQAAIRRARGITAFNIRSVTPREALAEIVFSGDRAALDLALAQVDISVGAPAAQGGAVDVTSGDSMSYFSQASATTGRAETLDLYLNRYRR